VQARKKYRSARWHAVALFGLMASLIFGSRHAITETQDSSNKHNSGLALIAHNTNSLTFALPVDCTLGKDCHVLAYMDKKPGPDFMDFGGGRQTYDEHDGTDFGIANETVMARGIAVKAAAAGVIVKVRNGVIDKRIENPQQAALVDKIGCGNAVVIDHTPEWRTYYCHLRNGSVAVAPGMQVKQGAVLGMVGSSGLASYPHLHFGVLYRGKKIDPFLGLTATDADGNFGRGLWQDTIKYVPTGLISAGFDSQKTNIDTIWQGTMSAPVLTTKSPAIVFWVHPFGVLLGDVEHIRLIDPDGKVVVESTKTLKSSNRINWLSIIGKKPSPEKAFRAGTWKGEYQLRRNQKLLIDINREIQLNGS